MFAAAVLTGPRVTFSWTFIQFSPCLSIWPNALSVLSVHHFPLHKSPVQDVLTLSYLAMSGCLLTFTVPCGFNQLHPSHLWRWDLSSDQCLAVFPPNWVSPQLAPSCARLQVNSQAIRSTKAFSRGSNCEPSWQQKDITQVSEPRIDTRALYFDLIPYTKGCVGDRIKVFSTRNASKICWVLNQYHCLKTTPGWWQPSC